MPGRKDACQFDAPPGGTLPGRNETNAGMFSFSVPNPYNTHEPILGRARRSEPVFMKIAATSCAGMSVYIERMIARSSTCCAVRAKTSLTSVPALPNLENLNGEP